MIKLSRKIGYRVVAQGIKVPEAGDLLHAMGWDAGPGLLVRATTQTSAFEDLLAGPKRQRAYSGKMR
jgi:EAL domain-containing protein (putative c-di-GMP-specific phosphodiesterase class I)